MLSNTSSGGEGGVDGVKRSGVRKLVKRNNKQSDSVERQKPKISRLGVKNKEKPIKTGEKTPESSIIGSDSERSDKSSGRNVKFDTNFGDEWNRRSVTTPIDDSWDDKNTEWDDLGLEPTCVKKKMYKCGPVSDTEEPSHTFPRLQAAGGTENRRFKNPEMEFLKQEVTEMQEKPVKIEQQHKSRQITSFLDAERDKNVQQRAPPMPQEPQTSWLRGSWLANVSKSVASLTAQVSQNISAALETENQPQTEDLRQLVAERLKENEESPRKGRKYLHKIAIEEENRPIQAFQESAKVPSNVSRDTNDNKSEEILTKKSSQFMKKVKDVKKVTKFTIF